MPRHTDKKQLATWVDPAVKQALERRAAAEKRSQVNVLEDAIRKYVEEDAPAAPTDDDQRQR